MKIEGGKHDGLILVHGDETILTDFNEDEVVIDFVDEVIVSEDAITFVDRAVYSSNKITTKGAFNINISPIDIRKINIDKRIEVLNIEIEKRQIFITSIETNAPLEKIHLKSKEILNLAVE